MAPKTLSNAFVDQLRDVYYAERQILKALPKMIRAAKSRDLKDGLTKHRQETEGQVERLQQVLELIGERVRAKTCPAIDGILDEGAEVMEEYAGSPALHAVIAAAGQAVEHYEIARYGTLIAWAEELGHDDIVRFLTTNLNEEKAANTKLNTVALRKGVNRKAAS